MVHAADHRHFMHDLRQVRQMFADVQAGHARRNRFEFSPHFGRRIGFHIDGVEMAGPAVVEDDNARTNRPARGRCRKDRRQPRQSGGQSQSQRTGDARMQPLAAAPASQFGRSRSLDHGNLIASISAYLFFQINEENMRRPDRLTAGRARSSVPPKNRRRF